jgi:hypothetical protein
MQTKYYVSRGGQNSGPWTIEDIAQRLARGEFAATDFLYDEPAAAWIPFLESKALLAAIKQGAPTAPPPGASAGHAPAPGYAPGGSAAAEPGPSPGAGTGPSSFQAADGGQELEWLVKRATRVYGPYTYLGLIRALQEKSVFEFDLVRRGPDGQTGAWARIAEHAEFQAERIRDLLATRAKPVADAFLARRFARRPIEQDAIVHDNQKTWIGRTFEGSEGGCGIIVRNALLAPGQAIHVHFGRGEGLAPFNALCEVVSKRFKGDVRDARAPVQYGMRFLQIDPRAAKAARELFSK